MHQPTNAELSAILAESAATEMSVSVSSASTQAPSARKRKRGSAGSTASTHEAPGTQQQAPRASAEDEEYAWLAEDFCSHHLWEKRQGTGDLVVCFSNGEWELAHTSVVYSRWRLFRQRWLQDAKHRAGSFRHEAPKPESLPHVKVEARLVGGTDDPALTPAEAVQLERLFLNYTYCYPARCEHTVQQAQVGSVRIVPGELSGAAHAMLLRMAHISHSMGFRSLTLDAVKGARNFLIPRPYWSAGAKLNREPFGNARPWRESGNAGASFGEQQLVLVRYLLGHFSLFQLLDASDVDDRPLLLALQQLQAQLQLFVCNNLRCLVLEKGPQNAIHDIDYDTMRRVMQAEECDLQEDDLLIALLRWTYTNYGSSSTAAAVVEEDGEAAAAEEEEAPQKQEGEHTLVDPPDEVLSLFDLIHWREFPPQSLLEQYNAFVSNRSKGGQQQTGSSSSSIVLSERFRAYMNELLLEALFLQTCNAQQAAGGGTTQTTPAVPAVRLRTQHKDIARKREPRTHTSSRTIPSQASAPAPPEEQGRQAGEDPMSTS